MLPGDVKKQLTSISEDIMNLAEHLPDSLKKLEDPQRLHIMFLPNSVCSYFTFPIIKNYCSLR